MKFHHGSFRNLLTGGNSNNAYWATIHLTQNIDGWISGPYDATARRHVPEVAGFYLGGTKNTTKEGNGRIEIVYYPEQDIELLAEADSSGYGSILEKGVNPYAH